MTSTPFATVIIRSFNRLSELRSLVQLILSQDFTDFEILIVDSSHGHDADSVRAALESSDPRIRVAHTPPRGCPAAANAGVALARGEVVVFIDDDDLPVGEGWLRAHLRNFEDPLCLGVNGFMDYDEGHRAGEAWLPKLRYMRMLSHGFFKQPRGYGYDSKRKVGIDYLSGGNASIRRDAVIRGGGWDDYLSYHNEHSLFLRLHQRMKPGEYFVYEPDAKMRIRKDVPGGLDYRFSGEVKKRVDQLARYFVWVVGREHPFRVYGLLPAFVASFALFSAVAGYELAAGRPVNKWVEMARGFAYSPQSLLHHMLSEAPVRRPNWIEVPPDTTEAETSTT